jgi:MFS family permease
LNQRLSHSQKAILFVVAIGVFVPAVDLTVVATMLRPIIVDLEIPLPDGLDQAAWIVNAYLIAYVLVMPVAGRLSDLWGRRTVFIGAYLLFIAGSIWVPLASDLNSFLVGRVVAALGGGAMVPIALAVVGDIYKPQQRGRALGLLSAVETGGWVCGPLYGALLVRFLSWHWHFYLNIPLGLLGLGLTWWVLREWPRPAQRPRLDWLGTAVLTLCLLSLNLALLGGGDLQSAGGFAAFDAVDTVQPAWGLYLLAAVALFLFVGIQRVQQRISETERSTAFWQAPPLLDLRLFRQPYFSGAILVNFLLGSMIIIVMVNVPLVVNVRAVEIARSAMLSGYLLSGVTGTMALFAYVGGRLLERCGYRPVTLAGLVLAGTGLGLMGLSWSVDTPYVIMVAQLVLVGMGFGLVLAPMATAVINTAPAPQRGVAASLVIVMRLLGMSVGLAALTAWGLDRFNRLRLHISLPDLPFTDLAYQQAIIDGLTQLTIQVLAETFAISAGVALLALFITLWYFQKGEK